MKTFSSSSGPRSRASALSPRLVRISKRISHALRHGPGGYGLALDHHGWTAVDALLSGLARRGIPATRDDLVDIRAGADKQRFELSDDGARIRATHGHTVDVEAASLPEAPPDVLYHGTAERNLAAILASGILSMSRRYVHLAVDTESALTVARRHGRPVLLVVDAARLHAAGQPFFRSASGIWLTEAIEPAFFTVAGT